MNPGQVSDWVDVMRTGGPYLIILVETATIVLMGRHILKQQKHIENLARHQERKPRKGRSTV